MRAWTRLMSATIATTLMCGIALAEPISVDAPDVRVGDIWRYRNVDAYTNEVAFEYTFRVIETTATQLVTILFNYDPTENAKRFFTREWNPTNLIQARFDPYYPNFRFPMYVGQQWHQPFRAVRENGAFESSLVTAKVVAFEKVTVPAGTFDAYRIERKIEVRGTDTNYMVQTGSVTTWYAPAVNNVAKKESATYWNGRERSKAIDELLQYVPVSLQPRM